MRRVKAPAVLMFRPTCDVLSDREAAVLLAKRWRDYADLSAREEMVRLVWRWACKYGACLVEGFPEVDLADCLSLAVLDAVDTYDPAAGALSSWTAWRVRQHVQLQRQKLMLSGRGAKKAKRAADTPVTTLPAAGEVVEEEELSDLARKLLLRMEASKDRREVVLAKQWLGYPGADVAGAMGISRQAAHQMRQTAKRRLLREVQRRGLPALADGEDAGKFGHIRKVRREPRGPYRRQHPWVRCALRLREELEGKALTLPEIRERLPEELAPWVGRAIVARPQWFRRVLTADLPLFTAAVENCSCSAAAAEA